MNFLEYIRGLSKRSAEDQCPLLMLAPMAGFTDRAMRILSRRLGADHVTTEMISSKAVWFKDKKTFELGEFGDEETPCSLQLFGDDPDIMLHAARELILRYPYAAVDINMGCPVPKIVKNHEGSALMKEPELVERIVYRLSSSLDIPVTVKIRAGWNSERMNAAEVAQYAERGGAAAISIHGRTREMMYRPSVILPIIKEVKEAVSIPVIGNGDITDGAAARRMLNETHCDGLMIGRAALGKPWIFDEIKSFLGGRSYSPPDLKETMLLHIDLKQRYKSDRVASNELRGQIPHYIKGKTGSAAFRNRLNSATSTAELVELINEME